ncbi:hypothetical protein Tco_0350361 [Tanacetum coccineum]
MIRYAMNFIEDIRCQFYCKRREDAVYTALEARRKELEARELDISARENSAAARENTFERDLKARIKLHKSSLKFSQIACLIPNVIKVEGSSMWGNLWCKYRSSPHRTILAPKVSPQGRSLHFRNVWDETCNLVKL